MKHFAEEISLLQTITGIGRMNAIYILAWIGGDMSVFHNAATLVGWAGLCQRNDESASKVFSRRIMHGNLKPSQGGKRPQLRQSKRQRHLPQSEKRLQMPPNGRQTSRPSSGNITPTG